jgi:protein-S-isoprenylcysteine O-methyltransferase Ste14
VARDAVEPLILDNNAAEVIFWLCVGGWTVGEVANSIRTARGLGDTRDRTVTLLGVALFGALALGIYAGYNTEASLPGPRWWPPLAGFALFAGGIWLRAVAVITLGRFFTYTVKVDEEQPVIATGPYRLIRHPSYTGLLMASLGVGLALDNWLSVVACLLPPLVGFTIRLLQEERVLAEQLGEPYRAYMRRTRRLIPGVW